MNHTYMRQRPNTSGCCLIGMFLAVFYGIWRLITMLFYGLWRMMAYLFRFMYYFYAWPLLLFEYLWKRGGLYRLMSIGLFVVIALTLVIALLRGVTSTTPPAVEAAQGRTATVTVTPTAKRVVVATRTRTATRIPTRPASATRIPTRPASVTTVSISGVTRPVDAQAAQVMRVIDGDTVIVDIDGEEERLRLIGIDTPESVDPRQPVQCFGIEASNYTKTRLTNQTIYLERDASQGEYDAYNRLLVYVWLDETTLFNYAIIADGYAFEYTYRLPYRYQSLFKEAQRNARSSNNGLWSPSTCNGNVQTQITATIRNQSPTSTTMPTATMTASERAYPCMIGQIKGNPDSMIYHVPSGQSYAQTRNRRIVCFGNESAAKLAGYRKASR